MTTAHGLRPAGQSFETCPAATGSADPDMPTCTVYPDRAHRCRHPRDEHARNGDVHLCLCGAGWHTQGMTQAAPGLLMPTSWEKS